MQKGRFGRRDRMVQPNKNDPYKIRKKPSGPAICEKCGAVFVNGRWSWDDLPGEKNKTVCTACKRIEENYPAGELELKGEFLEDHGEEIVNLIHNVEAMEKKEHPMERIMNIVRKPDSILVTTTGIHVARRIGVSISDAYQGELNYHYEDGEQRILITWER